MYLPFESGKSKICIYILPFMFICAIIFIGNFFLFLILATSYQPEELPLVYLVRQSLQATNFLNLYLPENIFILVGSTFFQHFKYNIPLALAPIASVAVNPIEVPCMWWVIFFFFLHLRLPLYLWLLQFDYGGSRYGALWVYPTWILLSFLYMCSNDFHQLWNVLVIIFSNFFLLLSFLSF